jgi:hypothetical protein
MGLRIKFTDRELEYLVEREAFCNRESAERWAEEIGHGHPIGFLWKFIRDCKEANEKGEPIPFYTV